MFAYEEKGETSNKIIHKHSESVFTLYLFMKTLWFITLLDLVDSFSYNMPTIFIKMHQLFMAVCPLDT